MKNIVFVVLLAFTLSVVGVASDTFQSSNETETAFHGDCCKKKKKACCKEGEQCEQGDKCKRKCKKKCKKKKEASDSSES